MKVTVIGSGNIKSHCNSASYLIDDFIMVDMPNGCCKNLKKLGKKEEKIKYLLLTHFHGDHYFDVPFYFLSRLNLENIDKNVYIYLSFDGIRKIKQLVKLAFPNSLKKIYHYTKVNYRTDKKFNIENINVEKVLVDHGNLKPAYGYLLNNGLVSIGFTGDTCLCPNVEYLASKSRYLFTDCALLSGDNKHMGIDNIEYLSQKYKDCIFVVSHMNDDVREQISKLKIKNVIVPHDGEIVEIKEV